VEEHKHEAPEIKDQKAAIDELTPEMLEKVRALARRKAVTESPHVNQMPGPECGQLVKVHGEHANHHVHQLRQNRYQCLQCGGVVFRFRKAGTVQRHKLLR
jgi:hypothetical protein